VVCHFIDTKLFSTASFLASSNVPSNIQVSLHVPALCSKVRLFSSTALPFCSAVWTFDEDHM
jgi:hypothetical protein